MQRQSGESLNAWHLFGLEYSDGTPDVSMGYVRGQLATVTDAAGVSTFTTSGPTRGTEVTGSGLLSGLVLTRTEFASDMPETVHAQFKYSTGTLSTITLNQHQWNGDGTLAKAWQGGRSDGAGGSGIRHVWNRSGTTGRLESISTEAFGGGATHGITRSYTHTPSGGRVEKLWYNAGPLGTPDTSVQGFDYDHDDHGRREVVSPYLPDNTPATGVQPPGWKYGYNERGEVELADRFKAGDDPDTEAVTHQRRGYAYDLMGNRSTATQGTNVGELNETGYTANILQQYDGITHTRQVEITGQAVAGATVELTLDGGTPITVNRSLPEHQTGDPDSFRYVHTMGGTDARWLHVSIQASLGGVSITRPGFTYVPPASESLDHDDDGNLTSDGQWTYTWDAENRLTAAEQKVLTVASGFTAPARKRLEFDYDYKNRRITKRVYQSASAGWALTKGLRFVYDGWQMIAELDHTFATGDGLVGSAVNRTFLWGPDLSGSMTGAGGVGGLLSTTYQGVTYQVCSDANGNVTGLVPVSGTGAGALVARFDYDPFGNQVTNAGSNVELCPFGFSSSYLDEINQTIYFGFRYYLPKIGRWLSRDPIEEEGGINVYNMVSNDTVNNIDVLGLSGRGDVVIGRLEYSCACGWIDWSHATPEAPRGLWQQINHGGLVPRAVRSRGRNGFSVWATQSQGVFGFRAPNGGGMYFVANGLDLSGKKAAGLSIWKDVSIRFETTQANLSQSSGFSEEDLPSDLIAFYRTVEGMSRLAVGVMCRGIGKSASLKLWDDTYGKNGGLGKNYSFKPIYHKCAPCEERHGPWPSQMNTIQDGPKGVTWDDWRKEIDEMGGLMTR